MFLTEKELFSQYSALKRTYEYFMENAESIKKFKDEHYFKSITFIGCGSGYSICQSAEISSKIRLNIPANSIAGGDLMLNFPVYENLLKDTLIIAPSRSGSTSEIVESVKMAKEKCGSLCISISAKVDSELSRLSDLSLEIPWAFDDSVCQTRTVTNLYTADLLLIAIMADDLSLIQEVESAINNGEKYIKNNTNTLMELAESKQLEKVVVLADCELQGIGSEAALAFKEIPQMMSNFYHILDVRHGPVVLIDDKTLVILACSPYGKLYQKDLILDIKKCGAVVVTVSSEVENDWYSDCNIVTPLYKNYAVQGIPFIFVPQAIAYFKALAKGVDPDNPKGLNPWIKL